MVREPLLTAVAINDLRPTQITVGMREVAAKRQRWREIAAKEGGKFLGKHMIPVVLGPKGRHYVVDHHHLARALHEEGVKDVAVTLIANLGKLDQDAFWTVMDNRSWMHPFDEKGERRHYSDIPKRVADLVDDPFRSLAGELRRAGGFAKDTTPFSEFLWADFLRRRMKRNRKGSEIRKKRGCRLFAGMVRPGGGHMIRPLTRPRRLRRGCANPRSQRVSPLL
jgi:hypothetical protein